MKIEIRKILDATKRYLPLYLVFNLIVYLIPATTGALLLSQQKTVSDWLVWMNFLIGIGFLATSLIGNIAIVAYSGFKAAKKGCGAASCGFVGLLLHAVVFWIMFFVGVVVTIAVFGHDVPTEGGLLIELFKGEKLAYYGISDELILMLFVGGLLMNFLIAAIGGRIGGAK